MNNITDQNSANAETKGTGWGKFASMTALGVYLTALQFNAPIAIKDYSVNVQQEITSGTQDAPQQEKADMEDLLMAFNHVHEELLSHPVDLDHDAKKILYENLWELYE